VTVTDLDGDDEALIVELSGLTAIEWPADETGDRIVAAVAAAASRTAGRGPGRVRPVLARYSRSPRRRWLAAAAAAAVGLLVAGVFQFTGGQHPTAGPGPVRSRAGSHAPSARPHRPARTWLTAMRVVAGTPALRAVGAVGIGDNFLTCVSRSVCYVLGSADRGRQDDIARSVNGGATWTSGQPLPAAGSPDDFTAPLSCPRPLTCFAPYGTSLLETSDGFAHYLVQPVSVPSLSEISLVSCPTTVDCVGAVQLGDGRQTFVYSHDGGASWTEASSGTLSGDDTATIAALNCDAHGACIAALILGTEETPEVAAVASADGGRSWTRSGTYSIVDMQQYMVSCGDAQDCLIGSNDGYLAWVHAAGGHIGIRVQPFPKSWGDVMDFAVGCASGPDCFVETSAPILEATRDAGYTWTSAPLAPSLPLDSAVYLSCPVPAGCVALASDGTGNQSSWVVLSNLRSPR
jgi:hypothetical protein